jgi:predicted nuclease of restriction endonuclease-like RecB superfamily
MLKNKNDPDRIWWLEIIGFWTPDYLKRKLERLKLAAISNLILCICNKLNCSDGDLPSGSRLVRFRGKIDPMDVIKIIEAPRTSSSNVTLHSL